MTKAPQPQRDNPGEILDPTFVGFERNTRIGAAPISSGNQEIATINNDPDEGMDEAGSERHPKKNSWIARRKEALEEWFSRASFRQKLLFICMLAVHAGLALAALIFLAFDVFGQVSIIRREARALAQVIGESSRSAVELNYNKTAEAILRSLINHPDIIGAGVYKEDGRLFVRLSGAQNRGIEPNILAQMPEGGHFTFSGYIHAQPVMNGAKRVGTVVVEHGVGSALARLRNILLIGILVVAVVTYTARNVLRRLEHNLVTPLHSLTRAAQDIAETGNVTIRAEKKSEDEVGQLADVFNAMLDRIQSHEELIKESRIALAEQIESRTAELQKRSLQLQDQIREAGEMEKRYRNLFENNPLPMFVLDLETLKIAAVNNAAVGHYQYAEREFLRTSMLDLTVLDDPLKLVRAFRSTEKTIDAGAWQHRKKNGEVIDVELIAHNILFNGRVGRIVLSKDVTEQNRARRQIEEMNRKLITMSRQAGMAEVATGVLHNVGNVLNSVNVSATVLENLEKRSKFAGVRKVAELLEANAGDLPALFSPGGKGEKLPPFMRSLADQLQAESGERAAELEQLSKNITHIKEIVASQQKFAKVTAAFEIVEAADLFDEALRVVQQDIETNRVRVQREYPTTARVRTDRHKVMQILINLFTNAQQAMLAMPAEDRLLTLKVLPDPEAGKTFLLIRDNGVGIAPDNLTRIFNHGFTTKKDGHGFGLHSSANTATEMGGKLTGHSDGIGTGAEFTLELPAAANSDVA